MLNFFVNFLFYILRTYRACCILLLVMKMRLKITKTKTNTNYYIIKDVNIKNKRTTQIVERLGNEIEVKKRASGKDIMTWIDEYIESLNTEIKKGNEKLVIKKSTSTIIEKISLMFLIVAISFFKKYIKN